MASADPRLKNIKIKTGVLKRLTKEKAMYEKEVIQQGEKVEKMKAEGKDEYDVKKQIEVLEESKMMIPDCSRRIRSAYADLQNLVTKQRGIRKTDVKEQSRKRQSKTQDETFDKEQEEELKETEEHQAAVALLAEHAGAGDQ